MKKYIKLISIIFISIVCFCIFNSETKAAVYTCPSDKVLICHYEVTRSKAGNDSTYTVKCSLKKGSGTYNCTIECKSHCDKYYEVSNFPEKSNFLASDFNSVKCPPSLNYRAYKGVVCNGNDCHNGDIISFRPSDTTVPLYSEYNQVAPLGDACSQDMDFSTIYCHLAVYIL